MSGPASGQRQGTATALAVGVLGGFAATVAMSRFQIAWKKNLDRTSGTQPSLRPNNPTDVEACRKIIRRLASISGVRISDATVQTCALLMHYGVGAGTGALYGLTRVMEPGPHSRFHAMLVGAGVGTAMFLAADEIAAPMLGLKRGSLMGSRAYGISSHVVYGVVLAEMCDQARPSASLKGA